MTEAQRKAAQHPLAITLVHGTWGRGVFPALSLLWRRPFWFEPGGGFHDRLKHGLAGLGIDAPIHAFTWSGANSIFERRTAAKRLAADINERAAAEPDRLQMVIGHSHGGSVAMIALRHMEEAVHRQVSIVTLATPFMEVTVEPPGMRNVQVIVTLLTLFGLGFSTLLFVPAVQAVLAFWGMAVEAVPDWMSTFLFVLGWLLAAVMVLFLLGLGFRDREERLIEATRDGVACDFATNVLVLRGIDDEATLVLAAGAIGNRLSVRLIRIMGFGSVVALALLFCVHFSGSGPTYVRDNLAALSLWGLWLAIPGLGLLFAMLSGLFKGVYGRELFVRSLLCQVNSHSAPDQPGKLWVITLLPSMREWRGLRHGLYDHERTVPTVLNWILRQIRPGEMEAPTGFSEARGSERVD
ncbi:MAG: hypothetical protein H6961_01380 [Chromatiaceae bacterium]|nr:hypothetical protein [Chromatiaceae bacterium]HPE79641.1 hypothetical protein [Gammaproteobacteria bacterium]